MSDSSRASWPRLSFGAMNMSGPAPAATSVRHLLKSWSNGCSTTVIVRSGFAARTASRIVVKPPISPPPEPYECHRVISPVRVGASVISGVGVGAAAVPVGLGDAVAPGPQAAITIESTARMPSPLFLYIVWLSPPGANWSDAADRGRPVRLARPGRPAAMPVGGGLTRGPRGSPAVVDPLLAPAGRAGGRAPDDEPGLEQLLLERPVVAMAAAGEQE